MALVSVGGLAYVNNQRAKAIAVESANTAPIASPTGEETLQPQKIGFIGDSWAGGAGAGGGRDNSYAGIAAKELGWSYLILPGGGTGYLQENTTTAEKPFSARAAELIAFAPDVVVVQGSSNDYRYTTIQIQEAASALFAQIRAALPDAKIIAVGVIDSPAADETELSSSRSGVSAAAASNDIQWVDGNAEGWLELETDFVDGYHPNLVGHQKVAHHLVSIVEAAVATD
ncbi:SGNH/GDSL hydrolase family protein [Glaciihabitans tibetensis]|uniref:SGNH/GDSL hydrolase family protein n=1 Tax=Glaciihabitans tibetensis TaxID=1266600 RepID=UPI0015E6C2A4|nr:SGNH/GDSL hydrolase family protein [Glaciihabitans tibetensis]